MQRGLIPNRSAKKVIIRYSALLPKRGNVVIRWFRTGSAYTGNGAAEFLRECFSRLPKRVWKVFVRAVSSFFNGEILDLLEENSSEYLIKVKMKNLSTLLMQQKWQKVRGQKGFESTEFQYKCHGWKRERRFVDIKKSLNQPQKRPFFPFLHQEFFCYVTNLTRSNWKVHKCYAKRSTSENWIEWCKNQMASGTIRTQDFWANSALFQTAILAYNLMVWMMWLLTKNSFHEEPNTIRAWLMKKPAKLIHRARQFILTLSKDYVFKERWREMEQALSNLNLT